MTSGQAKIRALIVDDEPLARKRLRSLLAKETDIEIVGEAGGGEAAVAAIKETKPDLLFLDVQMPGLDGFGVLHATAAVHQPVVIFVTAFDEHAIRAFDVEAVDYVLKPVVAARLQAAVRRAVTRIRETPRAEIARELARLLQSVGGAADRSPRLAIRRDGRVVFVRIADVDWVEADGDLLKIHAGREVHLMRETMAELESKLGGQSFVRVHRSAIINVDRVREVQPWFKGDYVVVLADGTKIRTGRTYRESVQKLIGD